MATPDDVIAYYETGVEAARFNRGRGALEFERTKEIILRHLDAPAAVADVGGAVGHYADWLANQGHRVELVDPAPSHVDLARERAGDPPRFGVHAADARELPFADASFDAVLLLGPLYHLRERDDRVRAVEEAARVCRPGGVVFAAAISRFAPLLAAVRAPGWLANEQIVANVRFETRTGQRAPADRRQSPFPDAYFHLPEELREELTSGGLHVDAIYGVEGPGSMAPDLDALWEDETVRARLLALASDAEGHPHLTPLSAHLLGVARKPAG